MTTFLIILFAIALLAVVLYITTKYFGVFRDDDNDGIPDEVEETLEIVKKRAKRVKEELGDVVDSANDVVKQSTDVIDAIKGAPRKGRKPSKKKTSTKKTK